MVQLLFSLAMYTVLRAFGQDVSYADVVLINEGVALFAGLMPVPGGVGVTEAALAAGFTAAGVDSATAMAAAMTYRLITFYAPPCLGFFAMRSLRNQQMLLETAEQSALSGSSCWSGVAWSTGRCRGVSSSRLKGLVFEVALRGCLPWIQLVRRVRGARCCCRVRGRG